MDLSLDPLLRSFLDAWALAVLVFDRDRRVIHSNPAARTLFEVHIDAVAPAERSEHLTLRDAAGRLVPADATPSGRALRGEIVPATPYELIFVDGRRRAVFIAGYPLRNAAGEVLAAACIVTERVDDHVQSYRLFEGLGTWLEDAERYADVVGPHPMVADANRLLADSLDDEATLDALVQAVVPRFADWCAIRLIAEDGRVLRRRTAYGAPGLAEVARDMERYFSARAPEPQTAPGTIGVVLRTGQPLVVSHVTEAWMRTTANDPPHLALLQRLAPASLMHVPLLVRGHAVGMMTFVRTQGGQAFTMRHLAIAEELCDRAAVAIENTRLFRESERRRHEAQALTEIARVLAETMDPRAVAQRIAESVRILLENTASAAVYSIESVDEPARAVAISTETGVRFIWTRVLPPGTGVAALAVAERRTIMAADVLEDPRVRYPPDVRAQLERSEYRALMAIPLIAHDRVLGALALGARSGRRFQEREIALLSAFADHAAVAFHNARLFAESERRGAVAEAANRSKDDFLAILSHELRTAILGWVRMLERGVLSAERTADALEAIDRNTRLQARLINDLLDVSRIVAGKLDVERQPVSLTAVLHDAIAVLRQDPHVRGLLEDPRIDPDAGFVIGDRVRLQQIITNLVSNAAKYTPAGGHITVTARRAEQKVEIVVVDTGEGIDPAELPRIFERFHQVDASKTRRHGGLGLGLTIVRHLVERHGGSVGAESEGRGKGARFTVVLPRAGGPLGLARAGSRSSTPATPSEPLRGVRVLFVDDNADARTFIRAALEAAGALVRTAASASDALGIFDREPFDIVMTDIGMPQVDGYDFVRQLRTRVRGAAVPAIALTAYAGSDDERRALAAGFQRHVAKPVDPDELVDLVRAVLDANAA
jgi:signal transduction histidine kinase/ActR/RegA family two-component response regulator